MLKYFFNLKKVISYTLKFVLRKPQFPTKNYFLYAKY